MIDRENRGGTEGSPKELMAVGHASVSLLPKEGEVLPSIPDSEAMRFARIERKAQIMAAASLCPEALRCKIEGVGQNRKTTPLSPPEIFANCFLVCNQADNWGMDPFMVAQCVSIVHGKICYEGKLIHAALEARLGVRLDYEWNGSGDQMEIIVTGTWPDGTSRAIDGTVAQWRTTHAGTPWVQHQYKKMLAYRGAREFARLYAPSILLGVYSEDELFGLGEDAKARRATPVGLTRRLLEQRHPSVRDGFSLGHVKAELAQTITDDAQEDTQESHVARAPPPPARDVAESAPSTPLGAGEAGGQRGLAPALPPALILEYSRTLARATQKKTLTTLHDQFWSGKGDRVMPTDQPSVDKIKGVFALHEERIDGTITAATLSNSVAAIASHGVSQGAKS